MSWLTEDGMLVNAFPGTKKIDFKEFVIDTDVQKLSQLYDKGKFFNCGAIQAKKKVAVTFDFTPTVSHKDKRKYSSLHTLGDVIKEVNSHNLEPGPEFIVDNKQPLKKALKVRQRPGAILSYLKIDDEHNVILQKELEKWKYLKGKKHLMKRVHQ